MQSRAVINMPKGSAINAVGIMPPVIPILCNHHVINIVAIVPKDIKSPCAKLENRSTA